MPDGLDVGDSTVAEDITAQEAVAAPGVTMSERLSHVNCLTVSWSLGKCLKGAECHGWLWGVPGAAQAGGVPQCSTQQKCSTVAEHGGGWRQVDAHPLDAEDPGVEDPATWSHLQTRMDEWELC